jgi:hypothetical protein
VYVISKNDVPIIASETNAVLKKLYNFHCDKHICMKHAARLWASGSISGSLPY